MNRLAHESSPYLLQHAHNPVDWYPWNEEAFEKARKEDKPILVSIGYAACHWCHVMERESFENEEVATLMNEHFVNIKVDREERPDVDHIYMEAVQAMTGSGGWPLNVFLTPEGKPFYGGTYFPPKRAFNRASWIEVLYSVARTYKEKKNDVAIQAENLTEHIKSSNSFGVNAKGELDLFSMKVINDAFTNIMKNADRLWGGFGKAPKFPQTFTITFLLQYAHLENNKEAFEQALLSLDKMIQGGIYDQAGGGFSRYSTDSEWLAPHFEKMLYDNALLVSTLADAYRLTNNKIYKQIIEETLEFIQREMMHEKGGFFSALDADSEGEEGKFYVWNLNEVQQLLGKDADLFCSYFDITREGNWEGKNILRIKKPMSEFAAEKGISEQQLAKLIKNGKETLLQKRAERVRPSLDDKIILGWNALMNSAFSKAYAATSNDHYKEIAEKNMHFMLSAFKVNELQYAHTWKNEKAKHPAFLDDYSNLIEALIQLAQITADTKYLEKAKELTAIVLEYFEDEESPFFYYTNKEQKDILLRKKEIYDSATPSGNAVMAANLYRLALYYDKSEWRKKAEQMLESLGEVVVRYPTSFGVWLSLLYEVIRGTNEIVVVGNSWHIYLKEIEKHYIPFKVIMASDGPERTYPLLADKQGNENILIYLCKNYACSQPVTTIERLMSLVSAK